MRAVWLVMILLLGCQKPKPNETTTDVDTTSVPVTPEDAYEEPEIYNYEEFLGVYDHESTTKGFSAVLALRQNGNDLYFTVSVSQGSCKGETEGVVQFAEKTEHYYTGIYEANDCMLQFTFMKGESKVEIKEVTLCKILGGNCSYEGSFVKRKN